MRNNLVMNKKKCIDVVIDEFDCLHIGFKQ